jgi:hypothetical protein
MGFELDRTERNDVQLLRRQDTSEELECSFLLADGALAEWVALQELAA